LIWSLRYHHRDGGFFWHSEPAGGDFFKAYHWPGFPSGQVYDEAELMALMRAKAFEIQGLPVPEPDVPKPPTLLPIENVGAIRWQGSVGASGYDIERAEKPTGPWFRIADHLSDADVQYKPLFNDRSAEIGKEYYYRVRASNSTGESKPGNVVGPVKVNRHTFVDEFENDAKIFIRSNKLIPAHNEARKYKEDIHRINGIQGEWLIYHLEGLMQAVKLYAFSADKTADLLFQVSKDGNEFEKIEARKTDYSSGEAEYGYLKPLLYSIASFPENTQFLKIEFTGAGSLSRIEIQYGR
jgi:hypothetical protein